ncbi:hypothetical protein [Alkalihalobacillus sp. AL-G]|uniref:hypothetical protein n=1 Tax=Alkalihalobacillus sp. AL-G TaxID=2926399 RepID=UPI00272DB110|nr:hypothetical protein [Alkalihalobacillus sp. AL-G]WLD94324.1 hypothetical protein MOJ78_05385 [Alkalihalobacillus sp. AL-G]
MKFRKGVFIIFAGLIVLSGCSNNGENQPVLIVEKPAEIGEGFEQFKEIDDRQNVETAKELVGNIRWANGNPTWIHHPDYLFYFKDNKEKYYIGITPNKEQLELEVKEQDKFVKLTKTKSNELYQILTGEKLSE